MTRNRLIGPILAAGAVSAVMATTVVLWAVLLDRKRRKRRSLEQSRQASAYEALIGNTPMVRLNRLSALIGRSIYVKMESLNPGQSGKDRAALSMIQQAEQRGDLPPPIETAFEIYCYGRLQQQQRAAISSPTSSAAPEDESVPIEFIIEEALSKSRTGGLVIEGTSGSTGISLATLCAARGHACIVVLPDDQASEKQDILTVLGAIVHIVPCSAISNPNHYVNIARLIAERARSMFGIPAVFIDQFENQANYHAHYSTTGPEILRQCPRLDGFVMSSGTGGTIAGVATYLKEQTQGRCHVVLVDPPGSALYHRIHHGVIFAPQQREQVLKRHRYDTLAEGIGLDRMTANFRLGVDMIDDAIRVTDQEAVDMAHWLFRGEGLWVGSSSAMNVVGAVRVASLMKPDSTIVTVICDAGQRHVTRFWNADFIREWGLIWPEDDGDNERIPACLQEFFNI